MRRYNLRRETEDQWSVIDAVGMETAMVGDVQMSGLYWAEAVEYVDLLNSVDAIERAAGRYLLSSTSRVA
jgi:hypothetical protein